MSSVSKVLIVDDDDRMCESLKELLSSQRYELGTSNSAKEAIEYLEKDIFDIVLLDIVMPDENGYKVMDYITSQSLDTLVVVMTGHASTESAITAMRKGAHDYLRKPFEPEELFATIKNALNHKRLKDENKQAEEALREREKELQIKTNELEEFNAALNVLLKKREEDKTGLEESILSNVRTLIEPYLAKLKKTKSAQSREILLNILESNLNEIVSPFTKRLSSKYINLTPSEIQVANLIKNGESTKEIATLMNLSYKTIESHREKIRKKLGIKNKKVNLQSYLLSLP